MSESTITWKNALALGYDMHDIFSKSAKEIAHKINSIIHEETEIGILAGFGGNGLDGVMLALELSKQEKARVTVYIPGRLSDFEFKLSVDILEQLRKDEAIQVKQDIQAEEIKQPDIFIEALIGTGFEKNKLRKKYLKMVKRFSHFSCKKVALDMPCPNYTPDVVYSIGTPKSSNAIIIQTHYPEEIELFCGPGEYEVLIKPNSRTHLEKNGSFTYIASDNTYVDLVKEIAYTYNTKVFCLITKEASSMTNAADIIEKSDTVLIGNLEKDFLNDAIIEKVITSYSKKNFVFFDSILENLDEKLLIWINNPILLFKRKQVENLQNIHLSSTNGSQFATKNRCNLSIIGSRTFLYSDSGEKKILELSISPKDMPLAVAYLACLNAIYSIRNDNWLSLRASFTERDS